MTNEIDIREDKLKELGGEILQTLLKDHTMSTPETTGDQQTNIFWATDNYEHLGEGYKFNDPITIHNITGEHGLVIRPRVLKEKELQANRTKIMAEVFTPSWICNKMINKLDEIWFGRLNVFNSPDPEDPHKWIPTEGKIIFPEGKTWQDYIKTTYLEITCGEGPYLVSYYDAVSGEIIPIRNRIGIIDRKLRVVSENTTTSEEWLAWARKVLESTYGYEWQGDSLLLTRETLMWAFIDYYQAKFKRRPQAKSLQWVAYIVSWNIWQMDGLTKKIPDTKKGEEKLEESVTLDLFSEAPPAPVTPYCKIRWWAITDKEKQKITYQSISHKNSLMKFDFIIGNPPYQQESIGANANDTPIYHFFYKESYKVGNTVELISPARFLFNIGGTPTEWNEQMLNDEHFKVLYFEQDSSKIFTNTDIKGGVAITYRNLQQNFKPIGLFTTFPELNSIKAKVDEVSSESLSTIISNRGMYRYSKKAYDEQPLELAKTADARIAPSCFDRMPILFTEEKPADGHEYIQIYGNIKNMRVYRWFRRDYIAHNTNLEKYKVLVPKANGSGAIGEVLSTPLIGSPLIGFTETYISIGETDSKAEAEAILKYVKTKFARTMLGILKVTQNNAKPTWKYVPLQDFTEDSDIDWSKSVADIDQQLYQKYNLSPEEITFIETKVRAMD